MLIGKARCWLCKNSLQYLLLFYVSKSIKNRCFKSHHLFVAKYCLFIIILYCRIITLCKLSSLASSLICLFILFLNSTLFQSLILDYSSHFLTFPTFLPLTALCYHFSSHGERNLTSSNNFNYDFHDEHSKICIPSLISLFQVRAGRPWWHSG